MTFFKIFLEFSWKIFSETYRLNYVESISLRKNAMTFNEYRNFIFWIVDLEWFLMTSKTTFFKSYQHEHYFEVLIREVQSLTINDPIWSWMTCVEVSTWYPGSQILVSHFASRQETSFCSINVFQFPQAV